MYSDVSMFHKSYVSVVKLYVHKSHFSGKIAILLEFDLHVSP